MKVGANYSTTACDYKYTQNGIQPLVYIDIIHFAGGKSTDQTCKTYQSYKSFTNPLSTKLNELRLNLTKDSSNPFLSYLSPVQIPENFFENNISKVLLDTSQFGEPFSVKFTDFSNLLVCKLKPKSQHASSYLHITNHSSRHSGMFDTSSLNEQQRNPPVEGEINFFINKIQSFINHIRVKFPDQRYKKTLSYVKLFDRDDEK